MFLEFAANGSLGNLDEAEMAPPALADAGDPATLRAAFDAAKDAMTPSLACPECFAYPDDVGRFEFSAGGRAESKASRPLDVEQVSTSFDNVRSTRVEGQPFNLVHV